MELPKDVWLIVYRYIHRDLLFYVNKQYQFATTSDDVNGICVLYIDDHYMVYNYRQLKYGDRLGRFIISYTRNCAFSRNYLLPQRYVYSNVTHVKR